MKRDGCFGEVLLKEVWWWWRQTGAGPFPASAAALTRKAGGRRACVGRAGRLRARQHSQNPRRRVVEPLLPSSVCENLYQSRCAGARLHMRIISQLARKWWRGTLMQSLFCRENTTVREPF